MPLTTYKDVIDHVIDFVGGDATEEALRFARRAVNAAYREVPSGRRWSYYYSHGRIVTSDDYATGTVAYTHATRTVTLTSGTWPSWAHLGVILIDNIPYQVATRTSDTAIVLSRNSNPGADIAAGTSYTLYQDTYVLPADFSAADEMVILNHSSGLMYAHPRDWLNSQQGTVSPGQPRLYAIIGDPNYFGAMAVKFTPPPDQQYQIDYIYQRRPRQLTWEQYATGLATTTSGSLTVEGTNTSWSSNMVGAVLRLAPAGEVTNIPTGKTGSNPFHLERIIMATGVGGDGSTTLVVDVDPGVSLAGVAYSISDPLDVEDGAMTTLLLREAEKQVRLVRRMKMTNEEGEAYQRALWNAWEADSRNFGRRADSGSTGLYRPRLASMPSGPDVS